MRIITGAVLASMAALTITACGGSSGSTAATDSSPQVSAAAACHNFATWYLSTGGDPGSGKNDAMLQKAASEAPSGTLYHDMSTLQSDVQTTASQSGSLGQAEENMTVSAAYTVEQDCQSVNPNS